MRLPDLKDSIPGFASSSHADKIKLFGWYMHVYEKRDRFVQENLRACYDELRLEKPANLSGSLNDLMNRKPRQILRDRRGYYLEAKVLDEFDRRFGQRTATVQVDKLLSDLPGKVSSEAERVFLTEVLTCFRHRAYRASIVMAWNLAFYHLLEWLIRKHLVAFNNRIGTRFPSKAGVTISSLDDFADNLRESEVIAICKSGGIVPANVTKILDEKLSRRNMAAHPSTVEVTQLQAEDVISDLVINVILRLT